MKGRVNVSALQTAVRRAAVVVPKTSKHPILFNVKLEVVGRYLRITASDLAQASIAVVACSGLTIPGAWTVPAQVMRDWVDRLPETENVAMALVNGGEDGPVFCLSCGESELALFGAPPKDFPDVEAVEASQFRVQINRKQFIDAFTYVSKIATPCYGNPAAIRFRINPDAPKQVQLITHDGGNAVWLNLDCDIDDPRVGLSSRPIAVDAYLSPDLKSCLKQTEGKELTFAFGEHYVTFQSGNDQYGSRLVGISFPDELDHYKPAATGELICDRAQLSKLLGRVQSRGKDIKEAFTWISLRHDTLILQGDLATLEMPVARQSHADEPERRAIAVNAWNVQEKLKGIKSKRVAITIQETRLFVTEPDSLDMAILVGAANLKRSSELPMERRDDGWLVLHNGNGYFVAEQLPYDPKTGIVDREIKNGTDIIYLPAVEIPYRLTDEQLEVIREIHGQYQPAVPLPYTSDNGVLTVTEPYSYKWTEWTGGKPFSQKTYINHKGDFAPAEPIKPRSLQRGN